MECGVQYDTTHLLFSAFLSHVVKIFEDRGSWNVVCSMTQRTHCFRHSTATSLRYLRTGGVGMWYAMWHNAGLQWVGTCTFCLKHSSAASLRFLMTGAYCRRKAFVHWESSLSIFFCTSRRLKRPCNLKKAPEMDLTNSPVSLVNL